MAQLQTTSITGSFNLKLTTSSSIARSMWFDPTSGYMKLYIDAWAAGGALITARQSLAGAGTQNVALAFGGFSAPFTFYSCTEEYDGALWSVGGALITNRSDLAGAGTQNEALAFGGYSGGYTACTEEYDGSSWSTGGALIISRVALAGAGTQNLALGFGGTPDGSNNVTCTEEYDGSSWSTGGTLITARYALAGAGTQNAGLAFGGGTTPPTKVSCTEEYNGSAWSAGGAMIISREGHAGAGTQNEALAFGGSSPSEGVTACTEKYNGTSWTSANSLITARWTLSGAGTQNTALAFGGQTPSISTCTEKYIGTVCLLGATIDEVPTTTTTTTTTSTTTTTTTVLPATITWWNYELPTPYIDSDIEINGTTYAGGYSSGSFNVTGNSSVLAKQLSATSTGVLGGYDFIIKNITDSTTVYNNITTSIVSSYTIMNSNTFTAVAGKTYVISASTYNATTPTGSIDTSFNIGTGFDNQVLSIATNSSGSIYVGGTFTTYSGSSQNNLIRLNSSGSKDTSFNIGTGFTFPDFVETMAVDSNGKLLVGGSFTSYSGSTQNYLVRLNTDGTKDTSFNIGTGFNNTIYAVSVDSNGKILVGGNFTTYSGSSQNYIVRLNTDGTKDTSFNIGTGFVGFTGGGKGLVSEIVVDSNGKILVGGNFTSYQGTGSNYLTRINSDGTKDTSFNNFGSGFDSHVYSIVVDSSGNIIAGGFFDNYKSSAQARLIRLNSDGSKDTSFNIGTGFNGIVYSLSIDSNAKIVAGGTFTSYSGSTQNYLVRLNTDGTKDTSFNIGSGFDSWINSAVIQSDGKILAGGIFSTYQGTTQNRLTRIV